MICEILVFGSLFFWLAVGAVSIALFITVENERWGWALTFLTVFLVACVLFGNLGLWVVANPWAAVYVVLGYIVGGVAWTIPKWILFMRRLKNRVQKELDRYRKGNNEYPVPEGQRKRNSWFSEFRCYGIDIDQDTGKLTPPTFYDNRDTILTWATVWPFSILWTVFRDIVLDGIELLVDSMKAMYERISNWFFKDIS